MGVEVPCEFIGQRSVYGDGSGHLITECDIQTPYYEFLSVDGYNLSIHGDTSGIRELIIKNGTVDLFALPDSTSQLIGTITVQQGGKLRPISKPEDESFTLNANSINIESNGVIKFEEPGEVFVVNTTGIVTVDGTLSANGGWEQKGGTLQLEAYTLSGSGAIQANGGNGDWYSGAGGRVNLDVQNNIFTGSLEAFGGFDMVNYFTGGPGVIYYIPEDKFSVVNNNAGGTLTLPEGTYTYNQIEIERGIDLIFAGENTELTLLSGVNSLFEGSYLYYAIPTLRVEGILHGPDEFEIERFDFIGRIDTTQTLSLLSTTQSTLLAFSDPGIHAFNEVNVGSGTQLKLFPYFGDYANYADDASFVLSVNRLNVDGVIKADGFGYGTDDLCQGDGPGGGWGTCSSTDPSNGGSHGGDGGYIVSTGNGPSLPYGSIAEPVTLGSGGGGLNYAGLGGGAIKVIAAEEIVLNGQISANGFGGGTSTNLYPSGGGAGGSIWLISPIISGNGSISTAGGGSRYAGDGSGGRISIDTQQLSPAITLDARGTINLYEGEIAAGHGSIYLGAVDSLQSTVVAAPEEVVVVDGTSSEVTVTLIAENGHLMPYQAVTAKLMTGNSITIDGNLVNNGETIAVGQTDENGNLSFIVSTATVGNRELKIYVNGVELNDRASINFIPENIDPDLSTITVTPDAVPADGLTSSEITATLKDDTGAPVENVEVVLSATGNAVVTQPAVRTDANGVTIGYIVDSSVETVTITASAGSVVLTAQPTVEFYGTDLEAALSSENTAVLGFNVNLGIVVNNHEAITAENVEVTLTLPADLIYRSDNSGVTPSVAGNVYTWQMGSLPGNQQISFTVTCKLSQAAAGGSSVPVDLTVSTDTPETDMQNNSASRTLTVVSAHIFNPSVTPGTATLRMGGTTIYKIQVENTGLLPDLYTISVNGLDDLNTAFDTTQLAVNAGGFAEATLSVTSNACVANDTRNFNVIITSSETSESQTISPTLTLNDSPLFTLDAPKADATIGSHSVLFKWRTDPATTGVLTIYPVGEPEAAITFPATAAGTDHSVYVDKDGQDQFYLDRNTSYSWQVASTSACGSGTSAIRNLTIGKGIIFTSHEQQIVKNRDYDQRIPITVQNTDSVPHTLTSSIINPYEDLIVNFVDSGSIDSTLTVAGNSTAELTLAIHAQDAERDYYNLTATLTAYEEGSTEPITDNATLNVQILKEGNFIIYEDTSAYDETTLARTYVIENQGQAITDLSLKAVDTITGLPASIYLTPSMDHVLLKTGDTIRVTAYPVFTAEDFAGQQSAYVPSGRLAKPDADAVNAISYLLKAAGGGQERELAGASTCGDTKSIYPVAIQDCTMSFETRDWYCTNRPTINTKINVPAFLNGGAVENVNLQMTFAPHSSVRDHNGQLYFNGTQIVSFENAMPQGTFQYPVPTELWNAGIAGMVTQNVRLKSQHYNGGHYVSATGYRLNVSVGNATTYACAASQLDANEIIATTYPCSPTRVFNPETDVFEKSVWNLADIKNLGPSIQAAFDVPLNVSICVIGDCADPIDTRSGVFSISIPDISFPTSVGTLAFQRSYSSGAVDQYVEMGHGWTHNHDEGLIFEDDPNGMEGYVLFKDHLGNQHLFKDNQDGTYSPGPGVMASLETTGTGYQVIALNGFTFNLDADGRITSLADAQGNAFAYTYDTEGLLTQVSADNGTRYLALTYVDGRIVSVSDHAGRWVAYTYDQNGDLVASTDLLGQVWQYAYDHNHRMTVLKDPNGVESISTEYDMLGRAYRQYDGEGNRLAKIIYHDDGSVTVVDANGKQETHRYDSRGVMINESDPLNRNTDTIYDTNFRPTSISNEIGSTLAMEWSADGKQLLSETDPAGNKTSYTYDTLGNLTSTSDPSGNTVSYTYNGRLLTSNTDAEGKTTTYTYTAEGWLESETNSYGQTTTYTYDTHGQRLTSTDWRGKTSTYAYNDLGKQTETVDSRGRITRHEYNTAGQLVRTIRNYDPARPQNGQNLYNITTEYTYDIWGNQATVTDTLGNVTSYAYDNSGRLIRTTDAAGNVTSSTYDGKGQLISSSDALGRVTTYVYDAAGRRLSTVNALGISSGTTTFSLTNNTSTASDSAGNAAVYHYNVLNQVVKIVDPMGHETTKTYNANGNVTTQTDELGRVTTYEYDSLNRLVRTTSSTGAVTQSVYDANGNRVASIDALGNQTSYTYDSMGRVTATTNALGHQTTSSYDTEGNLVSSTDALGRTTTYVYDQWGRKTSMTDGANRTTTYTYDALDRVISTTGPTGTTTTNYDALGRVVSRTDEHGRTASTTYNNLGRAVSSTDFEGNTTTNIYDEVGNLRSSTDGAGHITTYTYDVLNRRKTTTDALGNTTQVNYDNLGNVSDEIDANGVVTHYEYDSLQRKIAVIQNYKPTMNPDEVTNVRVDYTYNAVGNRTAVTDARGKVTQFQYDAANRVTLKIDPLGNTWSYSYDLAGNMISQTDGNGATIGFSYDAGGRLLTIDYPDPDADVSFSYNAAGQRVSMTDGIGTTTWTYNDRGRLISVNDAFGSELTYTYDEEGNRTGLTYPDGKQVAYSYDADNRLAQVADWDSQNSEYEYDALGQLTSILRPNGVNSTYEYNPIGRLTGLEHSLGVTSLANYSYTYDAVGNVIQAVEEMVVPIVVTPTPTATVTATASPSPTPDGTVIGEVGTVNDVTSAGVTVTLNHSYSNPVVIAQPGSYNDSDVALARVSDVTGSSFTVRMVEPAGGAHGAETVHYLVIESGSWELADGTHVEAGTVSTNATIGPNISDSWALVNYPHAFSDNAVVMSQVQTSNGQDYVDTRMEWIGSGEFRVAMEEEEASTTVHATETIGWVAFDAGSGTWNGKNFEAAFSDWDFYQVWQPLSFTQTYANPIFIGMETMNEGADPIHLRHTNLDGDSIDLMVEEDQTADSEMVVTQWQAISYLVIDGPCDLTGAVFGAPTPTPTPNGSETVTPTPTMTPTPDGPVIGEAGSVSNVTSTGVTVALNRSYNNPVVIAQPGSYNDSDVALARVSDVTGSSFTVRMVEPAGGVHGGETVHYLVIESGSWELADGTHVEAGTINTNKTIGKNITNSWATVSYPNAFTDSAVVISQVQSSNGQDYVDTRMKSIWDTMFRVAMEEEEASTTVHATETIGWVAFDAGSGTWNGRAYEVAFSEWWYTHVWETLDFTNTYTNPIFIGMETMNEGADPIHLRHANLDGNSIDLMVEEDQTADSEMNAAWQAVSYLVIDGPCDLTGFVYGAVPATPTATASATTTATATETPVPGNTSTPTETATETLTPTATATDEATATNEATETETPTPEGTEAGRLHDDNSAYKLARPMLDDPATETPTQTPESSQTPTATETAESSGPITIDYTYDALNRLTSAVYSNGLEFYYSYDAAGNVLAYTRVVDGISTVTSYTYDDANQLLTAAEGETTWYYTYNGNGSLVMSSPSQGEANGATRNTYNKAGYLVKVEGHDGTAWQTQSEMRYDGLGNRLEMTSYADGVGETIRYQLDNGQPLAAVGTESTSFYLYGKGVIGTKTDSWGYILQDGLGSTRQLATHEGVIAMSVAYTPWGDVLAYYGSGGIDFGYLGGMYDDATGLIYLGGGQYYDPVTGRMLTRGTGQSNPYKPGAFDPAGMMVAPLAMLGLVLGKKKKRGKWDTFIVLLVVGVVVGMSVSACTQPSKLPAPGASGTPTPVSTPSSTLMATQTPTTAVSATVNNSVKATPPPPSPIYPELSYHCLDILLGKPEPRKPSGLDAEYDYVWDTYINLWTKMDEEAWWWVDGEKYSFTPLDFLDRLLEIEFQIIKNTHFGKLPEIAVGNFSFWTTRVGDKDWRLAENKVFMGNPTNLQIIEYIGKRGLLHSGEYSKKTKDYRVQNIPEDYDQWLTFNGNYPDHEIPFKEGFIKPEPAWLDWRNVNPPVYNEEGAEEIDDVPVEWGNNEGGHQSDFFRRIEAKSYGVGLKTDEIFLHTSNFYAVTFCQLNFYSMDGVDHGYPVPSANCRVWPRRPRDDY